MSTGPFFLPDDFVEIGSLAKRRYEEDDQARIGRYLEGLGISVERRDETVHSYNHGTFNRTLCFVPVWVEMLRAARVDADTKERALLAALVDFRFRQAAETTAQLGDEKALKAYLEATFARDVERLHDPFVAREGRAARAETSYEPRAR